MPIRVKDLFSPDRWRSVSIWLSRRVVSILNKYLVKYDQKLQTELEVGQSVVVTKELKEKIDTFSDFERIHIIEQYMYRFLACNTCVDQGKCINCNCAIPARMFVRNDSCSLGYWQPFKDEVTWEKWKKVMGIKIKLTYNN